MGPSGCSLDSMGNWNLEITVRFQTVLEALTSGRLDGRQHRHAKAPWLKNKDATYVAVMYTAACSGGWVKCCFLCFCSKSLGCICACLLLKLQVFKT